MLTMTGLVISATSAAAASGYWLGGDDGGVFSFNAPYNGNLLIGGEFSTDGNSVCAQGCSIGSGSSTDNYVLSSTADLNADDFSDTVPEGLATLLFDGTGGAGGIPISPISPSSPSTPVSPDRPSRVSGVAGDKEGRVDCNAKWHGLFRWQCTRLWLPWMASRSKDRWWESRRHRMGRATRSSRLTVVCSPLAMPSSGVRSVASASISPSSGWLPLRVAGATGSSPLTAESSASVMPRMTDRWAGRTSMRRLSVWRLLWTARATGWLPLMEGSSRLGTHRLRDQWQAGRSAVRLPVLRPTDRCRNCCLRDRRQSLQRRDNNPGKS